MLSNKDFEVVVDARLIQGEHQTRKKAPHSHGAHHQPTLPGLDKKSPSTCSRNAHP
jgi:hypothetical protein